MSKSKQNKGPVSPKKKNNPEELDEKIRVERFLTQQSKLKSVTTVSKFDKKKKPKSHEFTFKFGFFEKFFKKDVPADWKPHSYNIDKQHLEFFKAFIFRHKFPSILLYGTINPNPAPFQHNYNRFQEQFQKLSKKWLLDILEGKSFYKSNKEFFSKAEAHYFLSGNSKGNTPEDLLSLYFEAKCKARNIPPLIRTNVASIFSDVFSDAVMNALAHGMNKNILNLIDNYISFLARFPEYIWTRNELLDVTDFVKDQIINRRQEFSFSGRTIQSVIELTNIWHREMIMKKESPDESVHWEGYAIKDGEYKETELLKRGVKQTFVYKVTQLLSTKAMFLEGQKMKHCVGSYTSMAAQGKLAIFNISRRYDYDHRLESMATVQISSGNQIVQARAKCNMAVDALTNKVLKRWASDNNLSYRI